MNKHALIIGAGVTGLTTAMCLANKGINCTIIAEKFMPTIVSAVAGALWEWPPAVCGYHHNAISLNRSKQWCMVSFDRFTALSANLDIGVFIRPVNFYFRNHIEQHPVHVEKMKQIQANVPGFCHDSALIKENRVNENIGLVDCYRHLAPMVDTDVYMHWLKKQVTARNIPVIKRKTIWT